MTKRRRRAQLELSYGDLFEQAITSKRLWWYNFEDMACICFPGKQLALTNNRSLSDEPHGGWRPPG